MPESLTFPIKNGLGVSNDRFGFKQLLISGYPIPDVPAWIRLEEASILGKQGGCRESLALPDSILLPEVGRNLPVFV